MKELRVKWLNLSSFDEQKLTIFFEAAQKLQFSQEKSWGYIVDLRRRDHIAGRFVERETVIERVEDPFGNFENIQRNVYHITSFIIRGTQPQLELRNPSRRLSKFLLNIGEIFNYELAVETVQCDALKWADAISKVLVASAFRLVEAAEVGITTDTLAKILFTGAGGMHQGAIDFLKGRKHKILRVGLSGFHENSSCKCVVSSEGQCTITGDVTEGLLEAVREALGGARK